jgi:hypothetical protein
MPVKLFALLIALVTPALAVWPNGYGFRNSITIQHAKVPNTNQTNFPILLCFNGPTGKPCDGANANTVLANLKVTGSGGQIINTVSSTVPWTHTIPADLIITDTDGTTVLPFEVESYVTTTGEIYIWVKIGTLTTGADYVVYIYYGNAAVTTDQSNPHGVWDANYKIVEHMGSTTTLNLNDSTTNAVTGTNHAATVLATAQLGGGVSVTTSLFADLGFTPSAITNYTIEAWINETSNAVGAEFPLSCRDVTPSNGIYMLYQSGNGDESGFSNAGSITQQGKGSTLASGTWHHVVATHAAGATAIILYTDSVPPGASQGSAASNPGNGASCVMGRDGSATAPNGFNGALDEVRFSNVVRSADWITTEYNNMSAPNTFYNLGAAQTGPPLTVTFPNANIFLSPYVWRTFSGNIDATTGGAYLKGVVSGTTSIVANIDTTGNVGLTANQMPSFRVTIDDAASTYVQEGLAATQITLVSGMTTASHKYRVEVIGPANNVGNGWTGIVGHTIINSLQFDTASVLSAPAIRPKVCLAFGDSYLEGYFGDPQSGARYLYIDYTLTWPQYVAAALNCEIGQFGIGGSGWMNSGEGGFGAFPSFWNFYDSTHARDLTTPADYLIVAEGVNDHVGTWTAAQINTAMNTWHTALRATSGWATVKTFIIVPNYADATDAVNHAQISTSANAWADAAAFAVDPGTSLQLCLPFTGVTWCSPDGTHPSRPYAGWMAATIMQGIQKALNVPGGPGPIIVN